MMYRTYQRRRHFSPFLDDVVINKTIYIIECVEEVSESSKFKASLKYNINSLHKYCIPSQERVNHTFEIKTVESFTTIRNRNCIEPISKKS